MKLLSVSLPRHDSSISYFDGETVRYIKLERTKQVKRYPMTDRWSWVNEVKTQWGLDVNDVDEIIFDFHPHSFYDRFKPYHPTLQKIFSGECNVIQFEDDFNIFKDVVSNKNIYYTSHHYAHVLSLWPLTDKLPDITFVIDGEGDHRAWSVYRHHKLIAKGIIENGSIGGNYFRAANFLGIQSQNSSDSSGKLMGLQSYGEINANYLTVLRTMGITEIDKIFSFDTWTQFHNNMELVPSLKPLDWIRTVHQRVGELICEHFKQYIQEGDTIGYVGGVAQNIVWNTELKQRYPNIIIPPHSSDEGVSLGGLEWLRMKNNLPPFKFNNYPYGQDDFAPDTEPSDDTIKQVAGYLAEGKIVGWYQGKGEMGPRALGNRSILMDPRIPNGKQKINNIKRREQYRPFGASVLKEHSNKYFDMKFDDDYMLFSTNVNSNSFPAITHIDGTCRVHTVTDKNPAFRKLLEEFYKLTGCGLLLNTSLNIAGKPLAGYPQVAKDLFYTVGLDYMVIGNEIYNKETDNSIFLGNDRRW